MRRPFLLIPLTLLVALWSSDACAQERIEIAIYRIDATEATSGCIGDAGTPRCALDTFFACTMRDQAALCEKIGLARVPFHLDGGPMEYTVISEITLREEIVPEHLRDLEDYRQAMFSFRCCSDSACLANAPARRVSGWRSSTTSSRPAADMPR